jgi:DNA replication protein DnaC
MSITLGLDSNRLSHFRPTLVLLADMHQLENKMRMIKLSGMVETLDMRLSQAQKEGLTFTQFLEVLLEDEVQHRANKKLASRIIRARFEEEKTLEAFVK